MRFRKRFKRQLGKKIAAGAGTIVAGLVGSALGDPKSAHAADWWCETFEDWKEQDPLWFDDHHHQHESAPSPNTGNPNAEFWLFGTVPDREGYPHMELKGDYTLESGEHPAAGSQCDVPPPPPGG